MLERCFERVAAFSIRHRRAVLASAAVAMALMAALAARQLTLKTSNLDLIDPELPPVAAFLDFAGEFGTPNLLVVVFEGEDEAALARSVDTIGPLVKRVEGVRGVVDRVPYDESTIEAFGLDPYITSHDRRMYFSFVQPDDPRSSASTIESFVEGVRSAIDAGGVEEGVRVGLTGMPEYALNDRDVIRGDISRLSIVSAVLVLGLFVFAFRSWRRPMMAVVALVVGVVLVLGVAAIYPGHLTLLSAFFCSILFGLGIDFGIHVVGRVEELTARGLPESEAVPRALGALARGLVTGALTTALVFFSMQFSGFRGFEELGFIAGIGVLICLATTLVVLPALLTLGRPAKPSPRSTRRSVVGRVLLALHRTGLGWVLGVAALVAPLAGVPAFDTDYLALQPEGSEAVRLEREMVARSDLSPQFAVFVTDSEQRALDLADRLIGDDTVGEIHSIADLQPVLPGVPPPVVPEGFLAALASPGGRYAVYAYPAENIWEPEAQARFVAHMRAIDERVTGMPFLGSYMIERSRRAMHITAAAGAVLLLLCVYTDFRRVGPTLVAVAPTLLTATSMLGLMRLVGIDFNPLNVMAVPVVIGIAVDDGVHVVHRFLAERGDLRATLAGTGRSVVLTSATTIAAFGSLAFTSHRGLASFAWALVLGVGSALVLSVVVLPGLLDRFGARLLVSPPPTVQPGIGWRAP